MSEGITEFIKKTNGKHGTKVWRAGVAAGIAAMIWMQSNFPTRREFERMERQIDRQLDRVESRLQKIESSVSVHGAMLGRRYE